ncbi:hypothetical protein [Cerasicoccus arenae]|uniref:Uncharacterized protein n=1 Tax=Cerasicoccus arenae TaxID=424488 RepID=A0A8J3DEY2_9BACT|nr:hypothetical protein [Cerasicoccus arenae]MBK1859916.1 hypothetical protein [Cerasicoccus arenae]GHC12945.1 hypothetical protein GCM10007047_32900 [Cerasicoccus arenae]
MDFSEIIVPIIVFIVWAVGQFFGKKEEKNQPTSPAQREAPPSQQNHPPPRHQQQHPREQQHPRHQQQPVSEDERTQRIQEEIRRKIAARREQSPQAPQPSPSGPPPVPSAPPPVPTQQPAYQQRKQIDYGRPGEQPQPSFYEAPPPQRNYEAEIAEQQRIVAATEQRAAEARAQAQAQMDRTYGLSSAKRRKPSRSSSTFTGGMSNRIKGRLRDPKAAREAFLYLEILGTPVGQREQGQMHPSWER